MSFFPFNPLSKPRSVSAYLLYALGEISLIVIGILAAVAINNWNESRKQEKQLHNILRIVHQEISADTAQVQQLYESLKAKEPLFAQALEESRDAEAYSACEECPYLLTGYNLSSLNTRGINLLKSYSKLEESQSDSLTLQLIASHEAFSKALERVESMIETDVSNTLQYWRNNYPWFASLMQGKPPEAFYRYMSQGGDYKNRLAYRHMLLYKNYLPVLKAYREQMGEMLASIQKRIHTH